MQDVQRESGGDIKMKDKAMFVLNASVVATIAVSLLLLAVAGSFFTYAALFYDNMYIPHAIMCNLTITAIVFFAVVGIKTYRQTFGRSQ